MPHIIVAQVAEPRTLEEAMDVIDLVRGTLADIAIAEDMTLEMVRSKAKHLYRMLAANDLIEEANERREP